MGSGCGVLYNEGITTEDLKCPCGYEYWDIFQERFVPFRQQSFDGTGRAMPLKNHEEKIKTEKESSEFESSMRAQFITHCISCGIKRRLDNAETDAGFDEQNFLRAMCELLEIAKGDFESRGRSGITHTARASVPVRTRGGTDPRTMLDAGEQHSRFPDPLPPLRSLAGVAQSPVRKKNARDDAHEEMQTSTTQQRTRTNIQGQHDASRNVSADLAKGAQVTTRDTDKAVVRSRHTEAPDYEAGPKYSSEGRGSVRHSRTRGEDSDDGNDSDSDEGAEDIESSTLRKDITGNNDRGK